GYLVIGIEDRSREIVGYDKPFDCDDLNKRISGATRHDVDCHFAILDWHGKKGPAKVGLLYIPKRSEDREPAQFLRDAPQSSTGKRAYKQRDIYFRDRHECRPAEKAEDYTFLCTPGRRKFVEGVEAVSPCLLGNNLGPRDPGFIRFVGREDYLLELW